MKQLSIFEPTPTRIIRQTSIDAHNSIKDQKQVMYGKIIEGMRKLNGSGTFEEVAFASGLKPSQVWKRLSELQKMGLIYPTELKRTLSSGRKGMVWQLVENKN